MKKIFRILLFMGLLSACSDTNEQPTQQPVQTLVPVALPDSYSTNKNTTIEIDDLLANDTTYENTVVKTYDTSSTQNGTVTKSNAITFSYTPPTDFVGTDSFTYTICESLNCATAKVTITVKNETSTGGSGNSGSFTIPSNLTSYYGDVDFSLTGLSLKDELATKISSTHTTNLDYSVVWNVLKQSDLDLQDNTKVILIYGYDDNDNNYVTDRTRNKNDNGGTAGTDWNREHVYPKSLGNPNLGTSGAGADAHHLRPSDVTFNNQRESKKFAAGSGNAGSVSGNWYPGDEWKGDVARMMMYMYLRYGNQCLPKNVGVGTTLSTDSNMIQLFLDWNIQDPVSDLEIQRNTEVANAQGNRNPFIDNPYLATLIWGGTNAENKW